MKLHYEHVFNEPDQSFRTEAYVKTRLAGRCHCHPEYELTWIEEGSGLRMIGFTMEPFSSGDLVLIPPMLPHHYNAQSLESGGETRKEIRYRVLKFRRELLVPLLKLPEFASLARLLNETGDTGMCFGGANIPTLPTLFRRICSGEGPARFIDFLTLLACLAEAPARHLSTAKCAVGADERIIRVMVFIQHEMERGHAASLAEAARRGCMTQQAFSSYFHKTTGKRFIDYMTELKLGRALDLLLKSDMNISRIALAAGFRNLSNFNRVFLARRGVTPTGYRRKVHSMNAAGK